MYYKDKRLLKLCIPASVMGQIKCIVEHFNTEVSWYGDITVEEGSITIKNVYLFPQVVTGGTFRTDTPQISELYDVWYEGKLNEVADHYDRTQENQPIMQYNGHSHVNAGCIASGEDITFRKSRVGINVYSIHNKQNGVNWEVWYDDVVYEHIDIDVIYVDDIFLKAKEYVLKPIPATTARYMHPANPIREVSSKRSILSQFYGNQEEELEDVLEDPYGMTTYNPYNYQQHQR